MMITIRMFVRRCLLTVFVLAVATFAIAGVARPETKPYAGTTVNIIGWKSEAIQHFVPSFEKAGKELGIKVKIHWYAFDDVRLKAITDYVARVPTWDIMMSEGRWIGEFFEKGIVTAFDEFMKAHQDIVDQDLLALEDLFPSLIELRRDPNTGKLAGLGWLIDSKQVLAYRSDLFENPTEKALFKQKYGYELGPPDTLWQYRDIAEFFTRKKGEELAGETLRHDFYGLTHSNKRGGFLWHDYYIYAMAFGQDQIFNPITKQPTLNSPQSIAAGKFYLSLVPFLPPGHLNMTSGESFSHFTAGNVVMAPEYYFRAVGMAQDEKSSNVVGKWDFTHFPALQRWMRHTADGSGAHFALYSLSKNKEATYKLIELVLSKKYDKERVFQFPYYVPLRHTTLKDPEVRAQRAFQRFSKKYLDLTIDNPDFYAWAENPDPIYPEAMDITVLALHEVLSGKKSVEEAYNAAQTKLTELFKQRGYIE